MTAALEGGEWSAARPGRTLPPGKTGYPFYRRLGGPQGRSGRAENLVPTGIRSRTAQPVAQSLYRLSYPAHMKVIPISNHKVLQIVIFSRCTPILTVGWKEKVKNLHELVTYEVRRIPRSSVTFLLDQTMLRNLHEAHEMNTHMWGNSFPSLSLSLFISLSLCRLTSVKHSQIWNLHKPCSVCDRSILFRLAEKLRTFRADKREWNFACFDPSRDLLAGIWVQFLSYHCSIEPLVTAHVSTGSTKLQSAFPQAR